MNTTQINDGAFTQMTSSLYDAIVEVLGIDRYRIRASGDLQFAIHPGVVFHTILGHAVAIVDFGGRNYGFYYRQF